MADEMEREMGRQRTYNAMVLRAQAGHVTGGKLFGYDNVEIMSGDGSRSHVERRINDHEANVVKRILDLCAAGYGYTRIAKLLNEEGAVRPRPQRQRPIGWAPSSVNEVLHRATYRGAAAGGGGATWIRTTCCQALRDAGVRRWPVRHEPRFRADPPIRLRLHGQSQARQDDL